MKPKKEQKKLILEKINIWFHQIYVIKNISEKKYIGLFILSNSLTNCNQISYIFVKRNPNKDYSHPKMSRNCHLLSIKEDTILIFSI